MASSNTHRHLPTVPILRLVLLIILTGMVGGLLFPALCVFAEKRYYSIQVGAYRDVKGARDMVSGLEKLGHHAFFREESISNKGRWFRVYIEKYKTRAEAEKEGKVLKELGLISEYAVKLMELPAPKPSPRKRDTKIVFFLHISSFREKANAESLADRLIAGGQKAFYVAETIFGERWFRVYIGEFGSEEEARNAGEGLQRKGVIEYFKVIEIDKKALGSGHY